MRIALLENRSAEASGEAGNYVAELAPLLAQDHRVIILTILSSIGRLPAEVGRIRRLVSKDRPDVVHINNLSGPALAATLWAIGQERLAGSPPIALGLHDDRLIKSTTGLNRTLTRSVRLIVSPTSSLLDRHLAMAFFPTAITEVIPYQMPYHLDRLVRAYQRLLTDNRIGGLGRAA